MRVRGTPIAAKRRMLALAIVFWIAVGCILHTYVIYPLLLVALDAIAQARSAWGYLGGNERRRPPAQIGLPNVSVLIAAYNEQDCIARRIENLSPRAIRPTSSRSWSAPTPPPTRRTPSCSGTPRAGSSCRGRSGRERRECSAAW